MVVKDYSRFFNEEGEELFLPVTMVAVKESTQASACSKILGPDGWTKEICVACMYFMGLDLLESIEESRISVAISSAVDSTFLALIPKKTTREDLGHFRPISLCNFVYKVI